MEHVDNVISILARANSPKVEEAMDYYQKIFPAKPQGHLFVCFEFKVSHSGGMVSAVPERRKSFLTRLKPKERPSDFYR